LGGVPVTVAGLIYKASVAGAATGNPAKTNKSKIDNNPPSSRLGNLEKIGLILQALIS
jgi:hypothetical protein